MQKKNIAYLIIIGLLLFSFSLRIIAFFIPHIENDEVIYQTLALKITKYPFDYSLQGTGILNQLPASQYDYPVFRHPPVFLYILALIYKILGVKFGILLPILTGALTVVLGFLIAQKLFSLEEGIITAFILSFCPILLFASTKIWIDTTYVFLMTLSFYLFMIAYEKENYINLIIAGVVFAISILTKYSALGLLLPLALYAFLKRRKIKNFILSFVIFSIVTLMVTLPWFIYYFQKMGNFSYANHFIITEDYVNMFPFVKLTLERPDHFYFTQLAIVTPLYVLSIPALFHKLQRKENLVLFVWIMTFLVAFILAFKFRLLGYVLRYMLPITVPLAILASRAIIRWQKISFLLVIILACYQLVAGILSSYIFYSADIFSIFFYGVGK